MTLKYNNLDRPSPKRQIKATRRMLMYIQGGENLCVETLNSATNGRVRWVKKFN